MKLQVFSIFDEKAQVYKAPMFIPHKGEALRTFSDITKNQETLIAKHPEDYKLYLLGTFDDNSGKMEPLAEPEFLINATDYSNVT